MTMRLLAILVWLSLPVAVLVAYAGQRRPPADLSCPPADAWEAKDADGCPKGVWGFVASPRLPGDDHEWTRAEVCAEIARLCAPG